MTQSFDKPFDRRQFIKTASMTLAGSALPLTMVELAFAKPADNFSFRLSKSVV